MANQVVTPFAESSDIRGKADPNDLHLGHAEIDRIVIAQADDADAWTAIA